MSRPTQVAHSSHMLCTQEVSNLCALSSPAHSHHHYDKNSLYSWYVTSHTTWLLSTPISCNSCYIPLLLCLVFHEQLALNQGVKLVRSKKTLATLGQLGCNLSLWIEYKYGYSPLWLWKATSWPLYVVHFKRESESAVLGQKLERATLHWLHDGLPAWWYFPMVLFSNFKSLDCFVLTRGHHYFP